ncbi:MAG: hypothetical protein B6242_14970 [Anaerolineaceae bacterium 4572_78]|nr:MAG: hypothetical protein B6242_14970 [Anaerolineaceae bacterium 4572_78]
MSTYLQKRFNSTDKTNLKQAVLILENPNFLIKASNVVGKPIEFIIGTLNKVPFASTLINRGATKSIEIATHTVLFTLDELNTSKNSADGFHIMLAALSGGVCGFFGLPGVLADLPVSTMVMLRSIAAIARYEGEDLNNIESQMECITVFALGGNTTTDDAAESAYFTTRATISKGLTKDTLLGITKTLSTAATTIDKEFAKILAKEGMPKLLEKTVQNETTKKTVDALVKFINQVSARYAVTVTEKVAVEVVPIIGAVAGVGINTLFTTHYQRMAHGHFTVRRLERKHGKELVKKEYEKLMKEK